MDQEKSIEIYPAEPKGGELIKVTYTGLLAKAGAGQVFLHVGYGQDQWEDPLDIPMQRIPGGWQRVFAVRHGSKLNFCFKDQAGNWDNNNGADWTIDVHQTH